MASPPYLTTQQVADSLLVSVRTVLRMVDTGDLAPAFKAPGRRGSLFFNPTDIAPLIEARHAEAMERAEALGRSAKQAS